MCSTVDGVSVITKCARLSISSSIMLAHQASSRPGGGASAGVRALHQPASCFIFDGDRRYVPLVPSYTVPTGPPHPTSGTGQHQHQNLTAVGPTPRNKVRTWGSWYEGTWWCPGWLRHRMFPWSFGHGHLGKYFCLVPGPVKSRPCRDHAVTAVQTTEVPLALVPGLRRPPTADALPPPSLASHLRQGMAGHGRGH